ncbi:MAG TPA: DUF2478 domain-containing protein [Bacteroides sp.]|nr:DUF2478 domain-containing protein [Bacteroides sp.]
MKDPGSHIVVVSGGVHGGKTSFTEEVVNTLKKRGLRIAGFLSRGTFKGGIRDSYSLINLAAGGEIPLATADLREGWFRYRRFYFNPAALALGKETVLSSLEDPPDLIVIDEVGPMELEGMGWHSLLQELAVLETLPQIWVARERVLEGVMERWKIPPGHVVRIDPRMGTQAREKLSANLCENIANLVRRNKGR